MLKDKETILNDIENYLILTNTFSGRNNYLIDYVYKLSIYHSIESLQEYLLQLKIEFIQYSIPIKINREFNLN